MPKIRYAKGRIKLKRGEYQRPNGTFEYKWTDRIGARHSVYAKTLIELRMKEEFILKDILDGIKCLNQNVTVNSYFEVWKRVKSGVRETTLVSYIRPYKRYVEPDFGNTKRKELSYSKVVMFYKGLIEKNGLGISTITKVNVVLSMVLDVAVKDGVLRNNPCSGALKELSRKYADTVKTVKALTATEQKLFEEYLNRPGPNHRLCPIITLMLYTGMRVGEACGLRWEDVDFDKEVIHVSHTLLFYDKPTGDGSAYALNPPKTKNSDRLIPMSPKVKEALNLEKQFQDQLGVKCSFVIDGFSDFVFVDAKGQVLHHKKLNHQLAKISKEIDNEVKKQNGIYGLTSFPHVHNHMLRHTFATRMREAGADVKATADIMGHNEVDITLNTYTDSSQEFKRREIALLDHKNTTDTE